MTSKKSNTPKNIRSEPIIKARTTEDLERKDYLYSYNSSKNLLFEKIFSGLKLIDYSKLSLREYPDNKTLKLALIVRILWLFGFVQMESRRAYTFTPLLIPDLPLLYPTFRKHRAT